MPATSTSRGDEPSQGQVATCGMVLWRDSIKSWYFDPETATRTAQMVIINTHGSPAKYVIPFDSTDEARRAVIELDQAMRHTRYGRDHERVYGKGA